jgi:hypothetical protein
MKRLVDVDLCAASASCLGLCIGMSYLSSVISHIGCWLMSYVCLSSALTASSRHFRFQEIASVESATSKQVYPIHVISPVLVVP